MASEPWLADWRASDASVLAWTALSAFCLVIEDISSRLEEVSSRPAACSVAPCANDCEAADIWVEADATCSDPCKSCWMILLNSRTNRPVMLNPRLTAAINRTTASPRLMVLARFMLLFKEVTCAWATFALLSIVSICLLMRPSISSVMVLMVLRMAENALRLSAAVFWRDWNSARLDRLISVTCWQSWSHCFSEAVNSW